MTLQNIVNATWPKKQNNNSKVTDVPGQTPIRKLSGFVSFTQLLHQTKKQKTKTKVLSFGFHE
jgi:hypothetical protein